MIKSLIRSIFQQNANSFTLTMAVLKKVWLGKFPNEMRPNSTILKKKPLHLKTIVWLDKFSDKMQNHLL